MDSTHIGPADDDFPEGFDPSALDAELEQLLRGSAGTTAAEPATSPNPQPEPAAAAPQPTVESSAAAPVAQPARPVPAPPVPPVPPRFGAADLPQPSAPKFQRKPPTEPDQPNYWGRKGLVGVYWIAILTGAIGQVIFFGQLFNMGWPGYAAAAIIATTAETIMVSAGDTAMHLRAQGRRKSQWVPFLLIAFTAASAASGMNLTHWWSQNVSMAIIFGGIAFLGFLLHVIHGFGEGTQFKAEQKAYLDAVAEYEAKLEAEDAAQRKAAEKAAREATKPPAPATRTESAAPAVVKPQTRKTTSAESPVDKATAVALGVKHAATTPSALKNVLTEAGHALPSSDTTIKNWCREIKQAVGSSSSK
ncbi:hypothetical protein L3Q67_45125 (plasmid) [Saccharothrix sp. AJ9571]|nr:hypothetical protein L3Q67_45125 [Saccharothrix sp. AJ9571]